jgi:acyl-homoserine lactone acylase PvdQ
MRAFPRVAGVVLMLASVWAASARAGEVTVYRDTWGVPHIYADNPNDASYGLGYAMAEDRLADIHKNIRTALGTMCEVFGPDHYETDLAMNLARNAQVSQKGWANAPEEVRTVAEYFIRGIQAYQAEHPDAVPDFAVDLQPWHTLAIGRTMILQWPLGNLMDKLGRKPESPPFSSNSYAVAPSRTADGSAVLLIDPHLTWESLAVFYEARVHGGPDYQMDGFFICGSPVVGLGHNGQVGWAMTTGGPDTGDVFMLKLKKDAPLPTTYEFNGEWVVGRPRLITIRVKGESTPRVMPTLETKFGVAMAEPDMENGVLYVGNTPYLEDTGILHQSYAMVKARNADEFYQALTMNHLMEQNVTYADRAGTIGYVRVGRTPIRPESVDCSRPIPATSDAVLWRGIHDIKDHVQVVNPAAGYMQNCNISPANMMVDSPLTPDGYVPYLYNVSWDKNNPRGKRMTQLLHEATSLTREQAKAIAMDVYDLLAKPWQASVADAVAKHGGDRFTGDGHPAEAARLLAAWNGEFTQDSTAATIMWRLRLKAQGAVDVGAIAEGTPLSAADAAKLADLLVETVDEMATLYGKFPVPWGETHQVGRAGRLFPYDGADFGRGALFTETVRDVESRETPPGSGRYVAHSGSMSAMIIFFTPDRLDAYTCTPWGQSGHPDSPHHTDQAEKLYSKRQFKPTWFAKADLEANVSSEKVLTVP